MFDPTTWFSSLYQYGYPGVLLISLIGHATIFFPLPTYLIVYALGSQMDPFWLGAFAGVGAAIGELTSYFVGKGFSKGTHLDKKFRSSYEEARKIFKKYGFWVIPFFAATPLPTDAVGLAAGALKYPLSKFFVGCLIGKLAMHWILAYGGYYSFSLVKRVFGREGTEIGLVVFTLIIAVLFVVWWKFGRNLDINLKKLSKK